MSQFATCNTDYESDSGAEEIPLRKYNMRHQDRLYENPKVALKPIIHEILRTRVLFKDVQVLVDKIVVVQVDLPKSMTPARSFRMFLTDGERTIQAVFKRRIHKDIINLDIREGSFIALKDYQIATGSRLNGQGDVEYFVVADFRWVGEERRFELEDAKHHVFGRFRERPKSDHVAIIKPDSRAPPGSMVFNWDQRYENLTFDGETYKATVSKWKDPSPDDLPVDYLPEHDIKQDEKVFTTQGTKVDAPYLWEFLPRDPTVEESLRAVTRDAYGTARGERNFVQPYPITQAFVDRVPDELMHHAYVYDKNDHEATLWLKPEMPKDWTLPTMPPKLDEKKRKPNATGKDIYDIEPTGPPKKVKHHFHEDVYVPERMRQLTLNIDRPPTPEPAVPAPMSPWAQKAADEFRPLQQYPEELRLADLDSVTGSKRSRNKTVDVLARVWSVDDFTIKRTNMPVKRDIRIVDASTSREVTLSNFTNPFDIIPAVGDIMLFRNVITHNYGGGNLNAYPSYCNGYDWCLIESTIRFKYPELEEKMKELDFPLLSDDEDDSVSAVGVEDEMEEE